VIVTITSRVPAWKWDRETHASLALEDSCTGQLAEFVILEIITNVINDI
jgi:hypothetical protein